MISQLKAADITKPLGEVARFIRGITFKPDQLVTTGAEGSVVCMRTKNVQADLESSDLIAVPRQCVKREEQYLKESDILVSTANSWDLVGKCCWIPKLDYLATAGGFISILRALPESVCPRYLYYWFSSPHTQNDVRHCGRQTTNISNMSYDRCLELQLPVPPLSEQKRIVDILDKADCIRRNRQETLTLTERLPLAIYREIFGNYLLPDQPTSPLCDAAKVVSGVAKGRKLNGSDIREVPYLRVANVQAGYLDLSEIKTIPAKEAEVKELALQVGDVVMTEGGDFDKLGRGAIWESNIPDCIHQNHVFRVRTDRTRLLPAFFSHFLQTEMAKGYFLRCAKKTTNLASINMTQLRALPVPLPPLKLQERFEQEFRMIVDITQRQTDSERAGRQLFNSLVHRAFRGEL